MRPARGSSAGATEVPRIGRVGSSRNELVPPHSSDVEFPDDSFPASSHLHYIKPLAAEIICHRTSVYVIPAPASV